MSSKFIHMKKEFLFRLNRKQTKANKLMKRILKLNLLLEFGWNGLRTQFTSYENILIKLGANRDQIGWKMV